jgi:hypothetical protein
MCDHFTPLIQRCFGCEFELEWQEIQRQNRVNTLLIGIAFIVLAIPATAIGILIGR